MQLGNQRPSSNFEDHTGSMSLKAQMGNWLLRNGYINNAAGKPYEAPWTPPTKSAPGDWPTNGADIPQPNTNPQGLMGRQRQPSSADNDRIARSQGFKNADMMLAFYKQRQNNMKGGDQSSPSPSGSWMDTAKSMISWHPAVTLGHVLDKMNQAIP